MKPIKVLQLIGSSGMGGAEQVVANLATRACSSGIQTEVGLLGHGWLASFLREKDVPVHLLSKRRALDWRLLHALISFIRDSAPDVVHCHLATMNLYGSVASHMAGIPAVVHIHGVAGDLDRPRRRWLHRLSWRFATRIVVVSRYLGQELRGMGAPAGKLVHIPNGVDAERFASIPDGASLRSALRIPESIPVVAVVARLEREKGVDLALECFAAVTREVSEARLLVAGDGSQRSALQSIARSLNIADRVFFLGHFSDIPTLLRGVDVVLVPSRSEGFSLAAIEAMAAARPVIAWDHQGPAEVIVSGETGELVAPFDMDAFISATVALLTNRARARSMGAAGRQRVDQFYTLETMLHRYCNLCRALAVATEGVAA